MKTPKTKIEAVRMLLKKIDATLAGKPWSFGDPDACPLCLYDEMKRMLADGCKEYVDCHFCPIWPESFDFTGWTGGCTYFMPGDESFDLGDIQNRNRQRKLQWLVKARPFVVKKLEQLERKQANDKKRRSK